MLVALTLFYLCVSGSFGDDFQTEKEQIMHMLEDEIEHRIYSIEEKDNQAEANDEKQQFEEEQTNLELRNTGSYTKAEVDAKVEQMSNTLKGMIGELISKQDQQLAKLESLSAQVGQQESKLNDAISALTPHVGSVLTVQGASIWGSWYGFEMCPAGSFAVGLDVKIESNQGSGDDSSLNAIKLQCKDVKTKFIATVSSAQGLWGGWFGFRMCPDDYYLVSFRLKNEGRQGGGDDSAINGINMKCRGPGVRGTSYTTINARGENPWGGWTGWSASCPSGQAICGIATRIEDNQGPGDDSALNDAKFQCCYF